MKADPKLGRACEIAEIGIVRGAILALTAVIGMGVGSSAAAERWGADYFPNVVLTTHEGRPVRFYDDLIKNKIVVLNLIYTSCQYACPLETARLAQVQALLGDRVGRDIFFYSITIDPEHDTPAVLRAYAERYRAGPGWLFLTGRLADIDLLGRKLGLASLPNPANPDGHTPSLLLGNATTGQWMRQSALGSPAFLARTIGDWLTSWQTGARPLATAAAALPGPVDRAGYMFAGRCAACHTIGGGVRLGPDLAGVTAHRDRAWLARFIVAPDQMYAAGDPVARALREAYGAVRMPNLGLTERDAAGLIDYIAARSPQDGAASAPSSPAPAVAVPDPPATLGRGPVPAAVVTPYLRIHAALSADRLEGINAQAGAIAAAAATLTPGGPALVALAGSLQRAADLRTARTAFAALTDVLLGGATSVRTDLEDIHVAYCPMARQYWIQQGDRIRNPYHGPQMLECGRLVSQRR